MNKNYQHNYNGKPIFFDFIQPISRAIRDSQHTSKALIECCKHMNWMMEGKYDDGQHMLKATGVDYFILKDKILQHKAQTETDLVVAAFLDTIMETMQMQFDCIKEVHKKLEALADQMHALLNTMLGEFPQVITTKHIDITMAACRTYSGSPLLYETHAARQADKDTPKKSKQNHMALGVALLEKCSKAIFIYAGSKPYLSNRGGKLRDRVEGLVRLADEGRNYDHLLHEFTYINKNKMLWDALSEPVQLLHTIIINSHADKRDTDTIVLCAHRIIKMTSTDTDEQVQAHEHITMLTHKYLGYGEFMHADLMNLLTEHRQVIRKGGAHETQCRRHLVITRDYVSSKGA